MTGREKTRHAHLLHQANETERKAERLANLIREKQTELDSLETGFNFRAMVDEPNPFFAHRSALTAHETHRRDLRRFIDDMKPIVEVIRDEAKPYREQAAEIEKTAQNRIETIQALEQELAMNGDLPKEKRELLTGLKTALLA